MWMGLLNQGVPQTDTDSVGSDDSAAWQRALSGLKTLEVCLAEPHAAPVLLETKMNLAHLAENHFLPPYHFPRFYLPVASNLTSPAWKR